VTSGPDGSVGPNPVAFMSYAHVDDDEDQLTTFYERLVKELQVQTGQKLEVFMDADIELGMPWRDRINEGLAASTFLLPILTPSFLASEYCREELHAFLDHEEELGRKDLILPVYYVECDDSLATSADERSKATWQAISSRQFFDWRHLRHKDAKAESVREERAKLARRIHKAMIRFRSEPPATVAEPPATAPATTEPSQQAPLPLEALFDPDLVRARQAAAEVAARGAEAMPSLVERLHGMAEPTRFLLREVLSELPDVSGPLMIERIETAEDHWQLATEVPECFGTAHAPVCQDRLGSLMSESKRVDVVRKAIEALGYLGAAEMASEVGLFLRRHADSSSDSLYDKYYGYCVTTLARIVRLTPMEPAFGVQLHLGFEYLESAVKLVSSRGWQSIVYPNMQHVLSRCKPHHAERLVSQWLSSDNEDMRDLGAYALGGIGASWTFPALLERSTDPAESARVRRTATFAAGVIGGAEALDGLLALDIDDERLLAARDNAMALCVLEAEDDGGFRQLAEDLIARTPSELCWVYRAIGLRGDDALLDLVRDGLRDGETSVRGDAALALARLAGRGEADALRRAREQASSTRERLLASLALLTIDEDLPGDPELEGLRELLAAESFMYRSVTQHDILETLTSSSHPSAAEIARAWKPMYDSSSAY
jgi:TIR domain